MLYCVLTRTETNIYYFAQRSKFSDLLPGERGRQTDTERDRERERERQRETERDKDREAQRERDKQTEEKRKLFIYEGNR